MSNSYRWVYVVALSAACGCAGIACSGDGGGAITPDGGSPDASTGARSGSGGASSGGASSGGTASGGVSSGGTSPGGGAGGMKPATDGGTPTTDGGDVDGGFVSQLPRPLSLPRPPEGRLPTELLPPQL
ncbi:MAG TPA: hypothetical protein VH062_31650 [Polyangiaceae bacterium]|jgi:hypothetical protein|nr:hypothetical protein [Polyangiaceae bacterium]